MTVRVRKHPQNSCFEGTDVLAGNRSRNLVKLLAKVRGPSLSSCERTLVLLVSFLLNLEYAMLITELVRLWPSTISRHDVGFQQPILIPFMVAIICQKFVDYIEILVLVMACEANVLPWSYC